MFQKKWSNIDLWINNAKVNVMHNNTWETDLCYTDSVINTNIMGMICGSQIAVKNMLSIVWKVLDQIISGRIKLYYMEQQNMHLLIS